MAASPAIPGLILCFAATVLLVIVCVSAPTWNKISFLNVTAGGITTHFGVFGYTGSGTSLGYNLNNAAGVGNASNVNTSALHNLTRALILHPIAAGLAGLAFLFGICGASYHRAGTIIMTMLAALAAIVTLVAFILDMVLFGIARDRFRDDGASAQYGNANWLTLGALGALVLGFCASACGVFGRYRRSRNNAY